MQPGRNYAMMRIGMPTITEMRCKCVRCGGGWLKRVEGRPVRCAHCKSPYWDVKRGVLKMGRPFADAKGKRRVKR